jgi:hypothetical protein
MGQPLSIRFQSPKELTGPTRDLFAQLIDPLNPLEGTVPKEEIDTVPLPVTREQGELTARELRRDMRKLEKERALRTSDGTATWIITDQMCFDPSLSKRVKGGIVGEGLGRGRIIYGPHDFRVAPGYYTAIIEFHVTSMLDARRVRIAGEVILNNKLYLSQQTIAVSAASAHVFRLPFRVREAAILAHLTAAIEVRLNVKGIVSVTVDQVSVVYKTSPLRSICNHPLAHLASAGNAAIRAIGKKIKTARASVTRDAVGS